MVLLAILLTLTGCAGSDDATSNDQQRPTEGTTPTGGPSTQPPPAGATSAPPTATRPSSSEDPAKTNLDIAMADARLGDEQIACVQDLEADTALRALLDPAATPATSDIAVWAPALRVCLDDDALARLALAPYTDPTDSEVTCASRQVGSLSDADLIALAAGDDTMRQQLAAICTAN